MQWKFDYKCKLHFISSVYVVGTRANHNKKGSEQWKKGWLSSWMVIIMRIRQTQTAAMPPWNLFDIILTLSLTLCGVTPQIFCGHPFFTASPKTILMTSQRKLVILRFTLTFFHFVIGSSGFSVFAYRTLRLYHIRFGR